MVKISICPVALGFFLTGLAHVMFSDFVDFS